MAERALVDGEGWISDESDFYGTSLRLALRSTVLRHVQAMT